MNSAAPAEDPTLTRKERTHLRILDAAARALRERGYAGVGVADVMRDAGLTHGGFYAHFASREALIAEAIAYAGKKSSTRIQAAVDAAQARGKSPLRAFINSYLDTSHLALSGEGCPVAALASDMPRQAAEIREASSARVRRMIAAIEAKLPPHVPVEHAALITGTLIGTLQMARAVGSVDEGKEILTSARKALITQYDL
jgi:TetR/AcrR family transcriptional repressor of nem operon